MEEFMPILGQLIVENHTDFDLRIYRGPKHKGYVGTVGRQSLASFPINDREGCTYLRAVPHDGSKPRDKRVCAARVNYRWVIE
jgi:hypothetical protein